MLRVLWLKSDNFGCGVYRCYCPALTLQEQDVDSEFLLSSQMSQQDLTPLKGKDLVVFQRCVTPAALYWMKACKAKGIATVFETDDDLMHIPRSNPSHDYWGQKSVRKMLRQMLELADIITVSTHPLTEAVIDFLGSGKKVRVCPNHLHPDIWGTSVWGEVNQYQNVNPRTQEPYMVIGWQGSTTHNEDFKVALPALQRLITERPNLQIRFFGCVPLSVKGVIPGDRFQFVKGVQFERYPGMLQYLNYDIGIAPVQDFRFNRSKSSIKYLEYAALSIPAVCSNVYPYAKAVKHGETGFLASTDDQWYEHLSALLDSPELRARIGRAAKTAAWRDSGTEQAAKWASAFAEARQSVTERQIAA